MKDIRSRWLRRSGWVGSLVAAFAFLGFSGVYIGGAVGVIITVAGCFALTSVALLGALWRVADRIVDRLRVLDGSLAGLVGEFDEWSNVQFEQAVTQLLDTFASDETPEPSNADLMQEVRRSRRRTIDSLTKESRRTFSQFEDLTALYREIDPPVGFPATRSWIASPDLLRYLFDLVRHGTMNSIVECGSGLSTVVLAHAVRQRRRPATILSLEHDLKYADTTRRMLRQHGLDGLVEVRHAPLELTQLEGEEWPWYRVGDPPNAPIDLLIVDGPPGATRPQARYPAVPLFSDSFASTITVVLDDTHRDDEQQVVDRWMALPSLRGAERLDLSHEKGTTVLRRMPAEQLTS